MAKLECTIYSIWEGKFEKRGFIIGREEEEEE